jgi:predicted metal-dependent hydrolase
MRFAIRRTRPAPAKAPETLSVEIGAERHAVPVKRSDRARRMSLRIDTRQGGPVLTLPSRVSMAEAARFLASHSGWLQHRLDQMPAAIPLVAGAAFPLRGRSTRIVHRPGRGTVQLCDVSDGPHVLVHGRPEHLSRRLTDWLKDQARQDLAAAVERHAEELGVRPAAIRVRDTGSRWGSCSSRRALSFSWRLILAPPNVLNYLAAHEVAHLREMNHSAKFWQLVALLDADYKTAQIWLKREGAGLFAVGRETGV